MSNNEKKVIESPFVFRTGMIIQCDNSDKNITIPSYLKMAYKGIIGPVQLHILDILYEYGYITRHTLSILMLNETNDDCKTAVRKLCNYGLLRKYHIEYSCENGFTRKTVDYYGLSSTGIQICKVKSGSGRLSATKALNSFFVHHTDENSPPQEILKILALNNFIATFYKQYKDHVVKMYKNVYIKKSNHFYNVRSIYILNSKELDFNILLVPIAVRRNAGWQRELTGNLQLIAPKLSDIVKEPVMKLMLILVEDNIMACEAEKVVRNCSELNNISVLYISDWAANRENILDNLLTVRRNNDYDIVRLSV